MQYSVGAGVVLELALELVEQLARILAEGVDQDVEAAAVGHADHDVLDLVDARLADHGVQQRDQGVAAFQREALLAHVLGVQVALQAFGGGQPLQDAGARGRVQAVVAAGRFQPLVQPLALLHLRDVHEFGADGAGIGRPQAREQVAQLHPWLAGDTAGAELAVQVAIGQGVEGQVQVRRVHRRGQAQRVDVRAQVAARAVGGDQAADVALALVTATGGGRTGNGGVAGRLGDVGDDRRMGDVAGLAALEPVEVGLPLRIHAVGGDQVLFVQVLDVGGIAAELRRLRKLLD